MLAYIPREGNMSEELPVAARPDSWATIFAHLLIGVAQWSLFVAFKSNDPSGLQYIMLPIGAGAAGIGALVSLGCRDLRRVGAWPLPVAVVLVVVGLFAGELASTLRGLFDVVFAQMMWVLIGWQALTLWRLRRA